MSMRPQDTLLDTTPTMAMNCTQLHLRGPMTRDRMTHALAMRLSYYGMAMRAEEGAEIQRRLEAEHICEYLLGWKKGYLLVV